MANMTASFIEQCVIALQHDIDEQYQYQPGEIVRGQVNLILSKPLSLRAITMKVNGEGTVSWQNERREVFLAQEIYVDAIKAIVDTTGQEPLRLGAGRHEFSFDYVLPDNIPSSYIGKHGNVTYTMKAMITGINLKETMVSSEPFLVLRRHSLPEGFESPVHISCEKRLFSFCHFGKLHMKVTLDRSGGVPGEDVFMQAEIKNNTKRTVTAIQGALIMRSVFRAQNNKVEFRQVISKKRDEFDVAYLEGRRWNFVRLPLPPYIPESDLECCDIIELEYLFQFRVELTGGSEIKMETPFVVGAIPKGLEIPEDLQQGLNISRHWTVRARGMLGIDEPPVDYEDNTTTWNIESVPEYRENSVNTNPLFQHYSYMNNGIQVMPDEYVENTRL